MVSLDPSTHTTDTYNKQHTLRCTRGTNHTSRHLPYVTAVVCVSLYPRSRSPISGPYLNVRLWSRRGRRMLDGSGRPFCSASAATWRQVRRVRVCLRSNTDSARVRVVSITGCRACGGGMPAGERPLALPTRSLPLPSSLDLPLSKGGSIVLRLLFSSRSFSVTTHESHGQLRELFEETKRTVCHAGGQLVV